MTVLVTGSTGHLGANLVRALIARKDRVRALVHTRPGDALEGLDVEIVRGDVLDEEAMRRAMTGVEICFHLAARISITGDRDGRVAATNVAGVRSVARAARRAGLIRFVHVSSVHAYDTGAAGPIDESGPRAADSAPAYDRAKRDGEAALREEIAEGLDAVIVNPSGILGPNDFAPSRMGRVFLALARGRMPALVDGGFDWVDARDVADSIVAATNRGATGENHLLPGRWASIRDLADLASRHTGVGPPRWIVPVGIARLGAPVIELAGMVRGVEPLYTRESLQAVASKVRYSGSRAAAVLGHSPRPLEVTVADLIDDFRRRGLLPPRGAAA